MSPQLAEHAVLEGIGKLTTRHNLLLNVAITKDVYVQSFNLSRSRTMPGYVLNISTGQLALVSITLPVSNDELAWEELLIGRPVLLYLQVDTKTLLDSNHVISDETDCSHIGTRTSTMTSGYDISLSTARENRKIFLMVYANLPPIGLV